MLISLLPAWIIALNVIGWPIIHVAVAKYFLHLPADHFRADRWLFRERRWERGGGIYQTLAQIRRWKHLLPDGAPFLRGFAKKSLAASDRIYLQRFLNETCRGEAAHWVMLLAAPIFFLWNPLWADAVMCIYALAANLPCIVTQRYNRLRLRRILNDRVQSSVNKPVAEL